MSTHPQLRPAVASDLDSILSVEIATGSAPHWSRRTYAAILDPTNAPERCLFVACVDGLLAGFAVGLLHPAVAGPIPDRPAELESVVVAQAFRRAGIGRALCNAVIAWCRVRGATEVVLEVRAASSEPIALYGSLGFMQTGRRPLYYSSPEDDALVMRLGLQ